MLWLLLTLSFFLEIAQVKSEAPEFIQTPQDVVARKGGIAELICQAKGTPPLLYEWFHNDKIVTSTSRRTITKVGNLYFSRVLHKKRKGSDTGSYYCTVSNTFGKVQSQPVNLTLGFLRSAFRKHPLGKTVSLGSKVVLACKPPRGKPKPQLSWLKDKQNVGVDGSRISLENNNQKLIIKSFQASDEGTYNCEATNVAGRRLSNPAVVVRNAAPVFTETPKDATVAVGGGVTFSCQANGAPTPNIIWKKEGNETVLQSTDGKLILTNLKVIHGGTYTCSAQNSEGSVSARARLTLNYPPDFINVPPDAHEMEGKSLKLSCLASGRPEPTTRWRNKATGKYYNIGQLYGNIHVKQDDRAISLIITSLQQNNAGTYTCEAENYLYKAKHDVKVLVHNQSEYAPRVTIDHDSQTADINSNTTFICDVDGNPRPSVKWLKVGEYDGVGDGIIVTDFTLGKKHRYVLNIPRVQEINAGKFQCQAVNKISTSIKIADLQVTRKLQLSEDIGTSVPAMPTDVKVSEITESSVRLRWNAAQRGPIALFAYTIGYINVDARSSEKYASSNIPRTSYYVKNLKPGTRYRFFVRGININGRGTPSLLTDVVKTKADVATTPFLAATPHSKKINFLRNLKLKISVHSGGPGELVVSWQEFKESQIIEGYHIDWKFDGGTEERVTIKKSTTNQYTISYLQTSTSYAVRVVTFFNAFQGIKSDYDYGKTTNEAIHLKMSVKSNDSDSITVEWKPLWRRNSGEDEVKNYTIWYVPVNQSKEVQHKVIAADDIEKYQFMIGALDLGVNYKVWMTAITAKNHRYNSNEQFIILKQNEIITVQQKGSSKPLLDKIKIFVLQPWFLGVLGGVLVIVIAIVLICCFCKRSSPKKDVDTFPIPLQDRNQQESFRKPCESRTPESDVTTPRSRGRESASECESMESRPSRVYRATASPSTPTRAGLDFPEISITPNKYERMYHSDGRGNDKEVRNGRQPRQYTDDAFDSSSRMNSRNRNPYSPSPKPASYNGEGRSDYDNSRPKKSHGPKSRGPYPGEAPPDYETAIAEYISSGHSDNNDQNERQSNELDDNHSGHMPYKSERYGNPLSRQSSCSPGSECSNQGSSVATRRKGLKPLPRLTIASVNWADMLPPPPSHPPPSSVATRSPPPSPTATSMCSETTYGRSHASSFLPRRSGSVVSGDLERATADSVVSGRSKGKYENRLPFDLAGITSDIIMQWADSVTNTSGSDNDSPCSSPSRVSGISSDGSFLTDTDFANAVKAAAECGGFNIDIDLNMYKDMDPISFQPFAGSLSTYNPETGEYPNKDSKPSSKKTSNSPKDTEGTSRDASRDASRSSRTRRARTAPLENTRDPSRDPSRSPNSSGKETAPFVSSNQEPKNNRKAKKAGEVSADGSSGYVPALTRTSALGKLEPVNRGPVKKKYAVVKTLPQVQAEDGADYPANYQSHSLSSSTSNASTIRSSSCPPVVLTDDEIDDDVL